MKITLYDIPSTARGCAWSPNVWKVRYCLNYKRIPYQTEWVEFPDIEARCKALGILPTSTRNGKDHYSLPAIHDPSTGVYVSDSFRIAEYLEKTYPETPSIFPNNSWGLQAAFLSAFDYTMKSDSATKGYIQASEYRILNPVSQEYFRRTREKAFGKTLEEMEPKGEEVVALWAKYKETMGKIDAWYAKTDEAGGKQTPYLMGDTLSWGDLTVAGFTIWLRIMWGEDSEKWQDIMAWHGGRWRSLVDNLKKYEIVNCM